MHRSLLAALTALAAVMAALVVALPASAAGSPAAYQVGFSLNCDNKTAPFCTSGVGLGGEWGWFAFNKDTTFDATIAFCSHEGFNGAFGGPLDGTWKVAAPTDPPIFGQSSDFFISFDSGQTWQDTDIPATAGHYSFKPAPGISAVAQVTAIPTG